MRALLPTTLLAVAALSACGGGGASEPRFVLLVSLDTVSAKHLSLYGYERPTTPFLEELAQRGVVFERHMVNSNNTLKSHASLFTGVFAPAHAVDDGEHGAWRALAPEWTTIAERFRDAGWRTAAFATHGAWLTPEFGMDQGFEHFDSAWRGAPENHRRFLDWLEREDPERAFVLLHDFDAHSDGSEPGDLPYEAPEEIVERFVGARPADYDGSTTDRLGEVYYGSRALALLSNPWRELSPEHLRYLVGLYDAGIAALDAELRALFAELDRRGILEHALVVITADHGEEFKEHSRLLHKQFYDEVMHVPLLIVPPRAWLVPRSKRLEQMTRTIDLAPTLLDLVGLEPFPDAAGRSFAAVLRGGTVPWQDVLFGTLVLRGRDELGRYKLSDDQTHPVFIDLARDPQERENLLADPERLAAARERIEAARGRLHALRTESIERGQRVSAGGAPELELGSDALQRLRDLGYADGDGDGGG